MKIRKINILLAMCLGAFIIFPGCSKDDGAIPERVSIAAVPTISTNIDPTGSQSIDLTNLASFAGKFKIDNYFPGTPNPTKVDIVVRKFNGTTPNNNNVKVYKAGVTTFPTNVTVTAAELATLFGTPSVLGDTYDFATDIYVGDRKFEAFPVVGAGTGAGLNGQPYFGEFARFPAICAYRGDLFGAIGSTVDFNVLTDEWGDDPVNGWGPPAGYRPVVKVKIVSATQLSFISPVNGTSVIVLTVNPANNTISFSGQPYGDLAVGPLQVDPTFTYGNTTLEALGPNVVLPCDNTLDLYVVYRVSAGVFRWSSTRGYSLKLKKA
jgi:hypothetical protein